MITAQCGYQTFVNVISPLPLLSHTERIWRLSFGVFDLGEHRLVLWGGPPLINIRATWSWVLIMMCIWRFPIGSCVDHWFQGDTAVLELQRVRLRWRRGSQREGLWRLSVWSPVCSPLSASCLPELKTFFHLVLSPLWCSSQGHRAKKLWKELVEATRN